MLVFVDLVLGPLLVFIIFKENKKYLKFDINTLLVIQIIAFLFGAYSLFLKHPAYAVFVKDRFTLINISHLHPKQHWLKQLQDSFFTSPKLVIAKMPKSKRQQSLLLTNIIFDGAPAIHERPELFEPLSKHINTFFARSIPINKLLTHKNTKKALTDFYNKHGGKPADYAYFPLSGNNNKDVIWVFKRSTAQPIAIIDTDPWI